MKINKNWIQELDNIVKENNLPVFDYFSEETDELFNRAASKEEIIHYVFSFPFFKIRDIIYDILEGKEKIDNLSFLLKTKLKISTQQAEKIANEIKSRIFELSLENQQIKTKNKKTKIQEQTQQEQTKEEIKSFDPYREPIE